MATRNLNQPSTNSNCSEIAARNSLDQSKFSHPPKKQRSIPPAHKLPKLEYDPAEYQLLQHLPRSFPKGPNDVYVSLKTAFPAQLKRCQKLLETPGCKDIILHGLGAATNRAVNLALQLQSKYDGLLEAWTTTGSVEISQELEPLRDDLDPISQTRFISMIRIKLYYTRTLDHLKQVPSKR